MLYSTALKYDWYYIPVDYLFLWLVVDISVLLCLHQVFSFGRHATPEDRAKAAKSANKKVAE